MDRRVEDLPELISELRALQARCRDYVVPAKRMHAFVAEELGTVMLRVPDPKQELDVFEWCVQPQAHQQIATKLDIPRAYYERMLQLAPQLLAANVNWWLKTTNEDKKFLVRLIDDEVRALLSDRYRPISHLDLLTTGVQVITGRDGAEGRERPWARGARCFTWRLTPTSMDVCLLNPSTRVDLNNLDRGVEYDNPGIADLGDGWIRANGGRTGDGSHWVYPAARIRNSETGHGGLYIQSGLFEAVCSNSCWLPVNLPSGTSARNWTWRMNCRPRPTAR